MILLLLKQTSNTATEPIVQLAQKMVPGAELIGDISMEVKIRLPNDGSPHFEGLFKELEDNQAQYGVQSFGISLTTLEEVFLRVAVDGKPDCQVTEADLSMISKSTEETFSDFELEQVRVKEPGEIFKMHFAALCRKRMIYFKRDLKGVFCEIVLPIIIITIGLLFTLISFIKDPIPKNFTPEEYYKKDVMAWANQPTSGVTNPSDYSDLLNRISVNKFTLDKRVDSNTNRQLPECINRH
jgi:ATP-binding cassette subfamily A (ABC1) protein 3